MRVLRMVLRLVLTALALLAFVPAAEASNETATSALSMTPISGQLFKDLPRPVKWEVEVEIKAPSQAPSVTPVKEVRASLPKEMSFNPDPDMAVCPDSEIGPSTNLTVPPEMAIAKCPDSVIGNGTAQHYIGGVNDPNGPTLRDGVVVIFNGGLTAQGLPKIKIYGYSQGAATGIYMVGVLDKGQLNVTIPVLPFDSATGQFHLSIPGTEEPHEDRRGQDPAYVRATCGDGKWDGQVDFLLGTRNTDGSAAGEESTVAAPPLSIPCSGQPGKAKLGKLSVKGPASVKQGKKATYRVKVTNSGTATAKGLKLSASGKGAKGASSAGSLAPGQGKTVKVKVKFTSKGNSKVKFKIAGKGIKAQTLSKKIKVT
jgi:hypothetical protein